VVNPNNGDPSDPSVDPRTSARTIATLEREPVVDAFSEAIAFPAQIGSVRAGIVALGTEHGSVFPPLIEGRQPDGLNEISVSRALARHARLRIGSRVSASSGIESRSFTVVGISVAAAIQHVAQGGSDEGAIMSIRTAAGFAPTVPPYLFLVRYAHGVDRAQGYAALRKDFKRPIVLQPLLPAEVRNLRAIRWTPYALVALLLLIGVATVAHLLLTSVRRRRRELAVLKTLGFVRGQVSSSVAWQASTLAVVSLTLGIPAGLALGRWVWATVAERLGLVGVPQIPAAWIGLMVVGTLGVTNLVAAGPGWIAGRIAPAVALRAE